MAHPTADKGKAVDRTERTPLLSGPSNSRLDDEQLRVADRRPRRSARRPAWRGHLLTALVVFLTVLLAGSLLFALLAWSYIPGRTEEAQLTRGVVWRGPERIDIINVTESGIWVQMNGYLGVDADYMLGVDRRAVAEGERGGGAAWWESLRSSFGRWAVEQVGELRVDIPDTIEVYPSAPGVNSRPLLSFQIAQSLPVPLTPALRSDHPPTFPPHTGSPGVPAWLSPVTVITQVAPLAHPADLLEFARQGWMKGKISVEVRASEVHVSAVGGGWRRWIGGSKQHLVVPMDFDSECPQLAPPTIPPIQPSSLTVATLSNPPQSSALFPFSELHCCDLPIIDLGVYCWSVASIPGVPQPGTDFASLIKLRSYSFRTVMMSPNLPDTISGNDTGKLEVFGLATVENFVKDVRAEFPYELGFGIFLLAGSENGTIPRHTRMADVVTLPVSLHGQDEIAIHIQGTIVDDLSANALTDDALSDFLRRYLRGQDNQVLVRGTSRLPAGSGISPTLPPPSWLRDFLPSLAINVTFPAPHPTPNLIRSVTIEDMKISERLGKMTASGVVIAVVELPRDMRGVDIDVFGVAPDVLVFDGDPPDDGDVDPVTPPYPAKAFGRIHPVDYLPASSQASSDDPKLLVVRAPIHNVPLDVLPGRDSILSDFVGKIIFKGGALAGVKGKAGVQVNVSGVQSQVTVDGVPVSGQFVVGKPRP